MPGLGVVLLSIHITPLKFHYPNPNFKDVEPTVAAATQESGKKTPIRTSNASVMEEVRFECVFITSQSLKHKIS